MGYTPNIVFDIDDLTPKLYVEIGRLQHSGGYEGTFAEQIASAQDDIIDFKGQRLVWLVPVTTSQTQAFREILDSWGITYALIGG